MESLGSDTKREEFEKKAVEVAAKIRRSTYSLTRREKGKVHEGYRIASLKQHIHAVEAGEKEAGPEDPGETGRSAPAALTLGRVRFNHRITNARQEARVSLNRVENVG